MLIVKIAIVFLPWSLKRALLGRLFGHELHPTSRIGFSWVYPSTTLRLGAHSYISHGTVIRSLDELVLGEHSGIGTWNWITGWPVSDHHPFFSDESDRHSRLTVGDHSFITTRHYIDCANAVDVGSYTTVGGVRTTIWSHEIDVQAGSQSSRPVRVGDYCYVGAGCTLLPGTVVPDRCLIAAGAVVTGELGEELRVYGGVPAKAISELPADAAYFKRDRGVVF